MASKEDGDKDAHRPDHPDEAMRFRRLQLQDEQEQVPANGLLRAKRQMDAMHAKQRERAVAAAGSQVEVEQGEAGPSCSQATGNDSGPAM